MKRENHIAIGMWIAIVSHFFFGYFYWDKIKFTNVFYVSTYFCMDTWGYTVFLLAKHSRFLKATGALLTILGSFFMYKEFNNPHEWTSINYATLALLLCNTLLLIFFTHKLHKKNVQRG